MSHILVTGANGFIGSHLVRRLLDLKKAQNWKEDIVCLVRSTSDLSSLKGLDIKLVIGDVRQPETLVNAVRGATYVFHLAAELYTLTRKQFMESITDGTRNMLEAADKYAKDSLKRFLLVSSSAAAGPSKSMKPLTEEDAPSAPVSWYAESKLEAEKIAKQFMEKIPITIVRPCAVYGEGDPAFLQAFKAVENRIHGVAGFRKRYTGMIYGKDCAEGMAAAALSPNAKGQIYFLSNPENYPVKDMVKTMAKAIGKPFGMTVYMPIFFLKLAALFTEFFYLFNRKVPVPTRDKVRDMSQIYWLCTPQKAEKDFGWRARTSLMDGFKATYESIKADERKQQEMSNEPKEEKWLKYVSISMVCGFIIEMLSLYGKMVYTPWWLVLIIIPVMWGLLFGTVAMLLRSSRFIFQFLPGCIFITGAELLNAYNFNNWYFTDNNVFGVTITNPVIRAIFLGIGTGFVIPIVNAVARKYYQYKQRVG